MPSSLNQNYSNQRSSSGALGLFHPSISVSQNNLIITEKLLIISEACFFFSPDANKVAKNAKKHSISINLALIKWVYYVEMQPHLYHNSWKMRPWRSAITHSFTIYYDETSVRWLFRYVKTTVLKKLTAEPLTGIYTIIFIRHAVAVNVSFWGRGTVTQSIPYFFHARLIQNKKVLPRFIPAAALPFFFPQTGQREQNFWEARAAPAAPSSLLFPSASRSPVPLCHGSLQYGYAALPTSISFSIKIPPLGGGGGVIGRRSRQSNGPKVMALSSRHCCKVSYGTGIDLLNWRQMEMCLFPK